VEKKMMKIILKGPIININRSNCEINNLINLS